MIKPFSECDLDDDPERIDLGAVWSFLSTEVHWGRWRTKEMVHEQFRGAWRVVGAYDRVSGAMVGFARAVSDGCGIAYLADVFVAATARGRGIGSAMLALMIDEGPGANFRWMLHTTDAHDFYEHLGFRPPGPTYLERPSPLASTAAGRRAGS